jgi:Holliday junction resolvasome RuvABC DNA-binding subunit
MATIKQISLIEPQMAIFIIKKLLGKIDDEAISQAVKNLNNEDFEELVNILMWLGYEEKTINEILK